MTLSEDMWRLLAHVSQCSECCEALYTLERKRFKGDMTLCETAEDYLKGEKVQ